MKLKKFTQQLPLLLLFSLVLPMLVNAQTFTAIGKHTQAARDGGSFQWAGPTRSTVTVQFIVSKSDGNEEIGYFRRIDPAQRWNMSGTNYSNLEIERNTTVNRNSGKLANSTGDRSTHYPFWVIYTFETPVPANEIFMMLHDVDRSGTGGKATGHIWINRSRNGASISGGTASNRDFQRMRWDNPNKELVTIHPSTGEINWDLTQTTGNPNKYIALAGNTTRTVKRIVVETEDIADDIEFGLSSLRPVHLDALPVVLHQFNALQLNDEEVRASWDVSETGNDVSHYELERSTGVFDQFSKVDSVPVRGLSRYQSRDAVSGQTGVIYYRLKMLYTDGHFKYSPVVAVSLTSHIKGLKATPNPAASRLTLLLESATTGQAFVQLINVAGQPVLERQFELVKGTNIIELENLGRFARGTYFLKTTKAGVQIAGTKTIVLN